ncbi:alpha/beta fold hydrolase [Streptomyces sp. NPDC005930]|uniref:alpha/beta fold hydrolase n=1 Tax=Streptomyces sp. NPDC005930 TaxID=3364736 RepID=UPI0036CC158F
MSNVVLLHGLANNEAVWSGLTGHWNPDVRIHAPRLPWHGGGITDWRHEQDSTALLARVLDQVPGGADVVVAHSFSSVLLLDLLGRRAVAGDPLDVAGVVLVNPFYRSDADDFHWDMIAPTLDDFPRTLAESIRLRTPDRPIEADLLADMARRMTEWIGPYGWLRFFEAYLRTPLFPVDLITTPALVIGGEADRSAPVEQARRLAAALPSGQCLTVPDCGHFPMLERPEWFTAAVHDFLAHHPRRVRPPALAAPSGPGRDA